MGQRLVVKIHTGEGREHVFKPMVLQATLPTRLRWLGRLGLPGLFDGEHDFVLEAEAGATRLRHQESFRGYLVPLLLWKTVGPATRTGFEAMNRVF